jgi:hypothetical protein
MSYPLDLARQLMAMPVSFRTLVTDYLVKAAEVERLRAELASVRDEQIAAVWALHYEAPVDTAGHPGCAECHVRWPCKTVHALDGGASYKDPTTGTNQPKGTP